MKTAAFLLLASAMSVSAFSQTSAPPAPTLTAGAEFKGLRFDWDKVPGATWYQFEYRAHQTGAFVQQGDDFPATATSTHFSFPLHLFDWTYARYRLAACNSAGCSRSAEISVSGLRRDAVGYFKASQSKERAFLGQEADLSSNGYNLVATAPGEITAYYDGAYKADGGAVYLWQRRSDGSWFQRARLQALDHEVSNIGEPYGFAELRVATSGTGNTVALGMPFYRRESSSDNEGEVDVFRFTNGSWTRTRLPHGPEPYTGYSVALSEDGYTLFAGLWDPYGAIRAFQVFRNSNGVWRYVKTMSRPVSGFTEECEITRLSRDFSTVADFCTEPASATRPAREYVRVFYGANWSVRTDINLNFPTSYETRYGHHALALDRTGETIAIQYSRDSTMTGTVGMAEVHVFKRSGAAFAPVTILTAGAWRNDVNRQEFGYSIAFSGDGHTLVIGDVLDNGRGFGPRAAPLLSGTDATGGAYVYRLTDRWRLANMVKPNTTMSPTAVFGNHLVLSDTGKTLVIGVHGESSAANGIDGNWANTDRPSSGALFMY
jgi:hypothetical protein